MKETCFSDREKLLKFETEGRIFAKISKSLEQFIYTVKVSAIFETECFLNLFFEVYQIKYIIIQIGKNKWDLETYEKRFFSLKIMIFSSHGHFE